MLHLDLQNAFHEISKKDFQIQAKKLSPYLSQIKKRKQGFYNVIFENNSIQKIKDFVNTKKGLFDDIVICGIGGSALGTITIRDALLHNTTTPKLHVLDNIDPDFITDIENTITLSRTLFCVISKSGETAETISQYLYFGPLRYLSSYCQN